MDTMVGVTMPTVRVHWDQAARHRTLIAGLVVGDVAALAAAFGLAYAVRFWSGLPVFNPLEPTFRFHVEPALVLLPLWLALFAASGLYAERNLLGGTREYALVANVCTVGAMVAITVTFLAPSVIISRGWLVLAWLFSVVCVGTGRYMMRRIVYQLRRRGYFVCPAVVAGANDEGRALAEQLQAWPTSGLRLVGFVDDEQPVGTAVLGGLRVVGAIADVPALMERYGVEEVVVASSSVPRPSLVELARSYALSDRLTIRLTSGLFEILTTGVYLKEVGGLHLIGLNKVRLNGLEMVLKTVLDYAIVLPALAVLWPVLAAIAVAVRLDSPGPVLYRRRVVGRYGRAFDALKFRSMYVDGETRLAAHPERQAELARKHKLVQDPRVTRVGAFLRRWSLDELPQLWNVLFRQMSLVGPRMISPPELEEYGRWQLNLLTVWPGITGLWQVSGRSDVGYEERVRLDMHYIRNYSIWLDLWILFRTIPALVGGKGAY